MIYNCSSFVLKQPAIDYLRRLLDSWGESFSNSLASFSPRKATWSWWLLCVCCLKLCSECDRELLNSEARTTNSERERRGFMLRLNFRALERLLVEEYEIDYLSCYLHEHIYPAVTRGGTTGAPRSRSKATGPFWTGSRAFMKSGAQTPDNSDLSVLVYVPKKRLWAPIAK